MASMLFIATHGTDNPTKAIIPFEMAAVAVKEGHDVQMALLGDGVLVLKDEILEHLQGLGTAPAKEALEAVLEAKIPVYACGTCMSTRGISDEEWQNKGILHMNKGVFIELVATSDRVVSF